MNRALYVKAKEMLYHRSGTTQEDMYWFDAGTGKVIAKEITGRQNEQITYSKSTLKAIRNYKGKGIVTLHTHPNSFPPSISDFNSNMRNGYTMGVVACHDGKIFAYTAGQTIEDQIYDFYVADGHKKGYTEYEAQLYALKVLSKNHKIRFREVNIT